MNADRQQYDIDVFEYVGCILKPELNLKAEEIDDLILHLIRSTKSPKAYLTAIADIEKCTSG